MHSVERVPRWQLVPGHAEVVSIHAVYPLHPDAWACEACPFMGDLHEALWHVVLLQWTHVWRPR